MTQRTHPVVDPVLGVLAMLFALAVALMCAGCTAIPHNRPVMAYSLINFAPSVKIQLGGSDARVDVNNEQHGRGHTITKETPIDAAVSAATDLKIPVAP